VRYWWVNQNQTYRHEISGGYLWSPKRNANKACNPFYESMLEVSPGDIIFSFRDTRIGALGIAHSYCYESPNDLNPDILTWNDRCRPVLQAPLSTRELPLRNSKFLCCARDPKVEGGDIVYSANRLLQFA
jgi:hypothetical protein